MDKIPIRDPELFAKWLRDNPHYTDWDIAVAAKVSVETVLNLRRKHGVRRQSIRRRNPNSDNRDNPYVVPDPPGDWRDPTWFAFAYRNYSISDVAAVCSVNRFKVAWHAWKLGLEVKSRFHPCNRRDWLYEHYVRQGYTVSALCKKAQVDRRKMRRWLASHGIAPRFNQLEHGTPVWWQKLVLTLRSLKFVKYQTKRTGVLSVRYRSSKRDYYTYDGRKRVNNRNSFLLVESDIRMQKIPKILSSREGKIYDSINNPLDFYISAIELHNSSLLERRLVYHTLAAIISGAGFFPNDFTSNEIIEDLPNWDTTDAFFGRQSLTLRPSDVYKPKNGFKSMCTFFAPPKAITYCLQRHDYLLNAMVKLERMKTKPLSFYTLLLAMAQIKRSHLYQFMMPTPQAYHALFKRLRIKGPILDVFPGFGAKYLAANALGIPYYTLDMRAIEYAQKQEIEECIGSNMLPYDGSEVEWLIYDNDMSVRDRELPQSLLSKTEHLMRFDRRNSFEAAYKIPISWNKYIGSAIYLAVD